MATHVENRQPNTLIKDSPINVGTLNVNKTSTEEEIINVLPRYYVVDPASHTNYVFDLDPSVNLELTSLFKIFINGNLIPTAANETADGIYLYSLGNQFKVTGSDYTDLIDLQDSTIHALYTPA